MTVSYPVVDFPSFAIHVKHRPALCKCLRSRSGLPHVQAAPQNDQEIAADHRQVRPTVSVCADHSYPAGVCEGQHVNAHQGMYDRNTQDIDQAAKHSHGSFRAQPTACQNQRALRCGDRRQQRLYIYRG